MGAEGRKYIHIVTPIGLAVKPHLNTPDTEGKYATGKFITELLLPEAETADLRQQILDAARALCPRIREPRLPIRTSRQDGTVTFVFKSSKKPRLCNAQCEPLEEAVRITEGSRIRVAGVLASWDKGLTAYVDAVQFVEAAKRRALSFLEIFGPVEPQA